MGYILPVNSTMLNGGVSQCHWHRYAFFAFKLADVEGYGLSWQAARFAVFVSGVLFFTFQYPDSEESSLM